MGNFPWKRATNVQPSRLPSQQLLVSLDQSLCVGHDLRYGQHALLGPGFRRFHLLAFTQPFDLYLYLPQQPAVCLSTLQSGGLDYHFRGELGWAGPVQADDLLSLLT